MGRTQTRKAPAATASKTAKPLKAVKKPTVTQLRKSIELVKKEEEANCARESFKIQVDSHKIGRSEYEVVVHEGTPLSVYLNWSDLRKNHNKFYIVQVL